MGMGKRGAGPVVRAVTQTVEEGMHDGVWRLRLSRRRAPRARMSQLDAHFGNNEAAISDNEYHAMERGERRRRAGKSPSERAETDIVVLAPRRV